MIESIITKPSVVVENIVDSLVELESANFMLTAEIVSYNKQAFRNRFEYGKLLFEHQDTILGEFSTWKAFCDYYGFTPSVISNNLRAYRFLQSEGVADWDTAEKYLKLHKIEAKVSNFEKLESLVNMGSVPQRPKDEQRLEKLAAEISEIVSRNESSHHNEIKAMAVELLDQAEQAKDHIVKLQAHRRQWKNEKYLEFVRSLGYDALTGQAVERAEPHHTWIGGEQGGIGAKLPDFLTLPLSPETHRKVESGELKPDELTIAKGLINTLSLFIMTHFK
jgi:hypothetical protein